MSNDNIVQPDIDLDAIEAEHNRTLELIKLQQASTNDDTPPKEFEKASLIHLNRTPNVDDYSAEMGNYQQEFNTSFTDPYENSAKQYRRRMRSRSPNKEIANIWNDPAWQSDDTDEEVDLGSLWDDDNVEFVKPYSKPGHNWWDKDDLVSFDNYEPQQLGSEEYDAMTAAYDKIEEVGYAVEQVVSDISNIESIVDETSSSVTYVSTMTTKLARDVPKSMRMVNDRLSRLETEMISIKTYLKLLVDHFIEEAENASDTNNESDEGNEVSEKNKD